MNREPVICATALLSALVITTVGIASVSPWMGGSPSIGLFATVLGGVTLVIEGLAVRGRLPRSYARVAAVVLGVSVLAFVFLLLESLPAAARAEPGVHTIQYGVGTRPLAVGGGMALLSGGVAVVSAGDWRPAKWRADQMALLAAVAIAVAGLFPLAKCGWGVTTLADVRTGGCLDSWRPLGERVAVAAAVPLLILVTIRRGTWSSRDATITGVVGATVASVATLPVHSMLVRKEVGPPFVAPAESDFVAAVVAYVAGLTMVGVGLYDWIGRADGRPRRALLIAAVLVAGPVWPLLVGAPVGSVVTDPLFVFPVSVAVIVTAAALGRIVDDGQESPSR